MERRKTPNRSDLIHHFLLSLETPCRELTEWEDNFVSSVKVQFQQKGALSDKQFEILERIYAEKTA